VEGNATTVTKLVMYQKIVQKKLGPTVKCCVITATQLDIWPEIVTNHLPEVKEMDVEDAEDVVAEIVGEMRELVVTVFHSESENLRMLIRNNLEKS